MAVSCPECGRNTTGYTDYPQERRGDKCYRMKHEMYYCQCGWSKDETKTDAEIMCLD